MSAKRKKNETIEDVIRMAVRVSERLAKSGVHLQWEVRFVPPVKPSGPTGET